MSKKAKTRVAPSNYWDMKDSVEKDKRIKPSDVFGKDVLKQKNVKDVKDVKDKKGKKLKKNKKK